MTKSAPNTPALSNKDTASILASMPMGLLVIDQQNAIQYAAGNAESLLQTSRTSLVRANLSQIFGDENTLFGLIDRARTNMNTVMEHDMRLTVRGQSSLVVDVQVTPMQDEGAGLLITLQSRQIPILVGQQDSVKAASKSVSGLAAMLAHEIKNPLSGIKGAAQLLKRRAKDDQKKLPQLICTEVDRIKSLVDDLEAFTDPKPQKHEPVNIHEVLNHVSDVAKAGFASKIAIKALYDPSLPMLGGNYDRLVQVFLNLVKNAAQAMDGREDGELRLSTAYKSGLWVGGDGKQRRKLPFEISVEDNGGGIAPDLIEHIFDPFVTGHEGGTGLGLALVAHFVADMDGAIECSNTDTGAIFRVRLPAYEQSQEAEKDE